MAFFAAFLSRGLVWSCCRPVSPAGTSVPGHGGSPIPELGLTSQSTDIQQVVQPLFWAFSFLISHDTRSEPLPWVRKKGDQRHCCLALALGRGYCPQWQCLLLAPISAQSVKSPVTCAWHCLSPCLPSCHPGNIHKFASRRISWPLFFFSFF